jgi:multisubunit Na+/H+ antiporter MnhE subunit
MNLATIETRCLIIGVAGIVVLFGSSFFVSPIHWEQLFSAAKYFAVFLIGISVGAALLAKT